jgi:hypothetical protein
LIPVCRKWMQTYSMISVLSLIYGEHYNTALG